MKLTSRIRPVIFGAGLLAAAHAQDAVTFTVPGISPNTTTPAAPSTPAAPAAPAPAAATKPKFTEAQIAEAYGWYMGAQMGLQQLEFTKEQVDAVARGMQGAARGGKPPFDAREIGPEVEAFLSRKNNAFMGKLRTQQMSEGAAFFAKLKENKNVTELPSGLRYEILKPGTGPAPKAGQTVTMHYTGSLASGQVFDSSSERGKPVELALTEGQIIPGMIEGLQKVGVGGKIKLYIPPSLGYGDQGNQAIPPGATLVFDVDVLAAKDTPPTAPAAK